MLKLIQLLPQLAGQVLNELPGDAPRTPTSADGPGQRPLAQFLGRDLEPMEMGIAIDHGKILAIDTPAALKAASRMCAAS